MKNGDVSGGKSLIKILRGEIEDDWHEQEDMGYWVESTRLGTWAVMGI